MCWRLIWNSETSVFEELGDFSLEAGRIENQLAFAQGEGGALESRSCDVDPC
jgi:hypothetical protein